MLVIRRRVGETILIGDAIEVEILEASPHRVKLGIKAPREVSVLRKETEMTRKENLAAAAADPAPLLAFLRGAPSPLGPV